MYHIHPIRIGRHFNDTGLKWFQWPCNIINRYSRQSSLFTEPMQKWYSLGINIFNLCYTHLYWTKTYFYFKTPTIEAVQKLYNSIISGTKDVVLDLKSNNYIYHINYATNKVIEIKQ